ncbi:MAG: hypothetical protein QM747_03850 [Nocardioides sp.]
MSRRWVLACCAVATCTVLSGCFGSGGGGDGSSEPPRHHHSPSAPTGTPTGSSSTPTSPTSATSPAGSSSALSFTPKSDGKHNRECLQLHPGDDPAEFLYYPVLVKASDQVDVDSVSTAHSDGVVVAGAWLAPAPQTPSTGTLPGWPPPKIFTTSSSVQWSQRVTATGATLDPGAGWYNVFLRIQVDPTVGDSTMSGVVFSYHDANGSHSDTWVDHVTFSMSC